MTKKCNKCRVIKPLTEFHKHPKIKDGKDWKCKSCQSGYDIREYKENKEVKKQRIKKWELKNPRLIKDTNWKIRKNIKSGIVIWENPHIPNIRSRIKFY